MNNRIKKMAVLALLSTALITSNMVAFAESGSIDETQDSEPSPITNEISSDTQSTDLSSSENMNDADDAEVTDETLIANSSSSSTSSQETDSNEVDQLIEVGVYTETVDEYDRAAFDEVFSAADIEFLEDSLGAVISKSDDTVQVRIKTKMEPSSEAIVTLYYDGNPVVVSQDGNVVVPANAQVISKDPPNDNGTRNVNSYDTVIPKSFYEAPIQKSRSNPEIVFKSSCGALIARMDEIEDNCASQSREKHKTYGDKYVKGDWVHCNRFNGQLSDDVHYNWRSANPAEVTKAGRNFYASDCHIALVQAGSGCTSKGSCQCNTTKMAAYCSMLVKDENGTLCNNKFHHHKNLVIPRKK